MKLVLGLPLTAKELIEQSSRRRTYLLRLLVGLGLGAMVALALYQQQRWGGELLGQGREVFSAIAAMITWLPVVLAPALCAAAIAGEREDASLPLLQMTRLGPSVIVVEKWLSRLIVLVALQVLALPLMALTYAFGGVSEELIWWSVLGAMAATAHATALAIVASAWCRGTVGALFVGYGLILASYGLVAALDIRNSGGALLFNAPALAVFLDMEFSRFNRGATATAHNAILLSFIPTVLALVVASLALRRREQGQAGNRLLGLFRRLDAWFESFERRRFGRTIRRELPRDRPVAWRECNRRTLVNPRYLTRILVPVGAVVVLIMLIAVSSEYSNGRYAVAWVGMIIEVALTLTVLVLGATAFAAERSAQTLEVLLTTPLTPRQILAQKISGLRRVHLAGVILLGLVIGIRYLVDQSAHNPWRYWSPLLALSSMALLPATMGRLGLVIGLHVRGRAKAVGLAVAILVGWTVAGVMGVVALDAMFSISNDEVWLAAVVPSSAGVVNHFSGFRSRNGADAAVAFGLSQLCFWLALRAYAARRVDQLLRRG